MDKFNISVILVAFLLLSKNMFFNNIYKSPYISPNKSHKIKKNSSQPNNPNTITKRTLTYNSIFYKEYEIIQKFFRKYTINIYIILLNSVPSGQISDFNYEINDAISRIYKKSNNNMNSYNSILFNERMYIFIINSEEIKIRIETELKNIIGENSLFIKSNKLNNIKYNKIIKKIIYDVYKYHIYTLLEKYKYIDITFSLMIVIVCSLFKFLKYKGRNKIANKHININNYKKNHLINNILNNYCIICLESFALENNKKLPDKDIIFLECKHIFHEGCIKKWFKKYNNCPICKIHLFMNNNKTNLF